MSQLPFSTFTGFGDDQSHAIKFGIRRSSGRLPNWRSPLRENTLEITNSSSTVYQVGGRDDWTIALPIWLPTRDAAEVLDAAVGTTATLRYIWGVTNQAGGFKQTIGSTDYLILPDTFLAGLELDESESRIDGRQNAVATFSRPYEANSYYGFAPYAPDEVEP